MRNKVPTCRKIIAPDLIEPETIMAQKYSVPERYVRHAIYDAMSNYPISRASFEEVDNWWPSPYPPVEEIKRVLRKECHLYRAKMVRAYSGMQYSRNKPDDSEVFVCDIQVSLWIKGRKETVWISVLKYKMTLEFEDL